MGIENKKFADWSRTPSPGNSPMHPPPPEAVASGVQVAAPPPESPGNISMFAEGTEVETDGLTRQPAFNGLLGIVQSWDPVMRRYDVLLDTPAGCRRVKLKRSNLKVRPPPPPSSAPIRSTTINLDGCLANHVEADTCNLGDSIIMASMQATLQSPTMLDSAGQFSWHPCELGMPLGWHGTDEAEDASSIVSHMQHSATAWDENLLATSPKLNVDENSPSFHTLHNPDMLQMPASEWNPGVVDATHWFTSNDMERLPSACT